MGESLVYLSLGSNLGDRLSYLRSAVERLSGVLKGLRVSSVYETAPMYVEDQPVFLNCAAVGATNLAPLDLLDTTQRIESELGRVREAPKGPRTIDVDLLLFGDATLHHPRLTLPHPAISERAFVLVPLLELDSRLSDPATGQPYSLWLDRLGRTGVSFHTDWDTQ